MPDDQKQTIMAAGSTLLPGDKASGSSGVSGLTNGRKFPGGSVGAKPLAKTPSSRGVLTHVKSIDALALRQMEGRHYNLMSRFS